MRARYLHWRRLQPDQEQAIRSAILAGAHKPAVAVAYGVSLRTVYRTLERRDRLTRHVQLGEYRARFELDPDGGPPVQVSPWTPQKGASVGGQRVRQ